MQLPGSGASEPHPAPQHHRYNTCALTYRRFGLFPVRSPLLGKSRLLSLPPGTKMVHFPGFALPSLCIQEGVSRHSPGRVAPFGYLRVEACLAAHRSFSLPATSFIASLRQGIHRTPLVALHVEFTVPTDLAIARQRTYLVRCELDFRYSVFKEHPNGAEPSGDFCRNPAQQSDAGRSLPPPGTPMVENTGFEPVTSWLQTRRSPS